MDESGFDCIVYAAFIFGVTAVDDDIDVVHDVAAEFYFVIGSEYLPVNSDAGKALCV